MCGCTPQLESKQHKCKQVKDDGTLKDKADIYPHRCVSNDTDIPSGSNFITTPPSCDANNSHTDLCSKFEAASSKTSCTRITFLKSHQGAVPDEMAGASQTSRVGATRLVLSLQSRDQSFQQALTALNTLILHCLHSGHAMPCSPLSSFQPKAVRKQNLEAPSALYQAFEASKL